MILQHTYNGSHFLRCETNNLKMYSFIYKQLLLAVFTFRIRPDDIRKKISIIYAFYVNEQVQYKIVSYCNNYTFIFSMDALTSQGKHIVKGNIEKIYDIWSFTTLIAYSTYILDRKYLVTVTSFLREYQPENINANAQNA